MAAATAVVAAVAAAGESGRVIEVTSCNCIMRVASAERESATFSFASSLRSYGQVEGWSLGASIGEGEGG